MNEAETSSAYGVVAIGRNEGERLKGCLRSATGAARVVYVDSGSNDGSIAWARSQGAEVVALDMSLGFTAARARNAGFRKLMELEPNLPFVQFVDGDCELGPAWPRQAFEFLEQRPDACAVFGRRRERYPDRSIYNRICDAEWNVPCGPARACGGDVMMRTNALRGVGGYRDDFIAGEEPELCVRLRRAGWTIWRIEAEMTLHDAAMTRFGQWWRRNVRSGYAFALGSHVHGAPPERLWVWECRRAWLWGAGIPLAAAAGIAIVGLPGLAVLLIYPLQVLRRIPRQPGSWPDRVKFGLLELVGRFAETTGMVRFALDRLLGRGPTIIEYK